MSQRSCAPEAPSVTVRLTQREAESLVRLADYYLTIRPLRPLVRLTAPGPIRRRYRFIAEESRWLKRLAKAIRDDARTQKVDALDVAMTAPALVALWGRILASLRTPRSRRRLSTSEIETREALSARFGAALTSLLQTHQHTIEEHLATRRPAEAIWMRQELQLPVLHATPE